MNTKMATVAAAALISFGALATLSPANARTGHGLLGEAGLSTGILTPTEADAVDDAHEALRAAYPSARYAEEAIAEGVMNTASLAPHCAIRHHRWGHELVCR